MMWRARNNNKIICNNRRQAYGRSTSRYRLRVAVRVLILEYVCEGANSESIYKHRLFVVNS